MLLFMDGFENYSSAIQLTAGGWNPTNTAVISIETSKQRTGSRCLDLNASSANYPLYWTPPVERASLIVGHALMYEDMSFTSGTFLSFFDRNGNLNARITINSDNTFSLYTVGGSSPVATSTLKFQVAMWQFLEAKLYVDGSAGTFVLRVFGTELINYTGNTKHASAPDSVIGSIGWRAPSTSMADLYLDDLYILDTTGAQNNDFLGDCYVKTYRPTGDGSVSQFTPNSGGTKYTQVDDSPNPDGDTTYIYDGTNGEQQLFTRPGVDSLGAIAGVMHSLHSRKDGAGVVSLKSLAKVNGTIYKGGARTVGDNYLAINEVWELNPDTGLPWNKTGVDGAEFGVEVVK